MAHREAQRGVVAPVDGVHQAVAEASQPLLGAREQMHPAPHRTHDHRRDHRHIGEAEQDGPDEGEGERERHGLKHLATDAGEEENGGEDDEDDDLPVKGRVHHRAGGGDADLVHVPLREAGVRWQRAAEAALELVDSALHDDDGAVDDNAEVDGSEAHQIGPHAEDAHQDEGEEQREGNERGRDDAAAQAAEQQHQHEHHDESALGEIARYGRRGAVYELRAVEKRLDAYAGRQGALHLGEALLHTVDHLVRVLPLEHHYRAAHGLVAVLCERAVAHLRAIVDIIGSVAHGDGHTALVLHHDAANVIEALHHALAADETGLMILLDVGSARVEVVAPEGLYQVTYGDMHGVEMPGREGYLILLHAAAEGVDLHHARYHAQLPLHCPVLYGAQLLRRILRGVGLERVLQYLAEPRADGPHLGCAEALGNVAADLAELLLYQ